MNIQSRLLVLLQAVALRDWKTFSAIAFPFYLDYLGLHALELYRSSSLYHARLMHFEQDLVEGMFLEDTTWRHFLWRARQEPLSYRLKLFLCGLLLLPLPAYEYREDN